MFGFFEENKVIKILAVAVIIISLLSYFWGSDPKELLDQFQIRGSKKNKAEVSLGDQLEKRLDQIDAKHFKKNKNIDSNEKRAGINCPPGTIRKEENPEKEKVVYCVDEETPSIKEGPYLSKINGGYKKEEGYFKNGRLEGKLIRWGKENKKSEEIEFLAGQRNGSYFSWYPNGVVQIEGQYINDYKSGIWKYYDQEGKIISTIEMKNNQKNGKVENFYGNGKLEFNGNYKDDKQEGAWIFFRKDGSIQMEGSFLKGKKVGKWIEYDSANKPLNEKNYDNPSAEITQSK